MTKKFDNNNVIKSRKGMTLTEVLVAMTLIVIIIFVFTPTFLAYFRGVRNAGIKTQQTYERASIMERLVANKQGKNDVGYETEVSDVPLVLKSSATCVLDFSSGILDSVRGTMVSENLGRDDSYVTFYTEGASNGMVCFPASLTDDFLTKDIRVVPKGFTFANEAFSKTNTSGYHFEVYNTNSSGVQVRVDSKYYEINKENDGAAADIAKFTFKGANNVISFENSPLYIKYYKNSVMLYEVEIEIGAPEIIMVGEKASDGNYYYYVTKGVDTTTGNMEILAKKMSGDYALSSAMNDVEWVAKGRGDDGNGGVNKYGYFVMGGDAGQVRRFWRNETTGNYYWGGDVLNNYNCKIDESGGTNYETFTKGLTTQANYKMIYRGNAGSAYEKETHNVLFDSNKITIGYKYQAVTFNYFTANVGAGDEYYLTMAGAFKKNKKYEYYGFHCDMTKSEYNNITGWISNGSIAGSKLNIQGYKEATNYDYPDDDSLITITSVGAVQINKSNSKYYESQDSSIYGTSNVYPTSSYTLYCGYIPLVTDVYGWKTSNLGGWSIYVHTGTLGAAYSSTTNSWYPTGKFGGIRTTSTSLNSAIFPSMSYKDLLNYYDTSDDYGVGRHDVYPYGGYTTTYNYKPGTTVNGKNVAGQALTGQGEDYYLSGAHEVDITTGYLSEPFAISVNNPEVPTISGLSGADYYFEKFNSASGKFDHAFFSSGLRNNVTMLDVKSYHDDITGNNISMAVGYSLAYIFGDYNWATRIYQVYNTGLVYIRATGDGTDNDTTGDLSSGKGWSLAKETNVFHQFFGIDQYYGNDSGGFLGINKDGTKAILGWDTTYHRRYFNISSSDSKAPQPGYSPDINEGSTYGTNCHPLADTKCTTCNWGTTGDGKPQAMWGTENGTLMSWFYDQETPKNSKITSVTKEFESAQWFKSIAASKGDEFYDQSSVNAGLSSVAGFISTLTCINDVCCADDVWVAVGNQSKDSTVQPNNICAGGGNLANGASWKPWSSSNNCSGEHASYINVKYCADRTNNVYLWQAIKICDYDTVNVTQISYNQGIWYALGYIDTNGNGKNDSDENAVLYYSTNPTYEWKFCKTKTSADSESYINEGGKSMYNNGASSNSMTVTAALTFDDASGEFKPVKLSGINSAASQG